MHSRCQGHWKVGLLCVIGLLLGGCVISQSQYDAAVADMKSARTDLEKSRMMREALAQENENLRAENEKVALDIEVLGAEIQRVKESHESERNLLAAHEAELEQAGRARAKRLQDIQHAYQQLKRQNRALRETVRRYQKELKEARESAETLQPNNGALSTEPMTDQTAPLEPPPVSTPLNGALAPVNLNSASAKDLIFVLGLTEAMAEMVVANRPYRLRGELLAKHVVSNVTFDAIQDRITAAPN